MGMYTAQGLVTHAENALQLKTKYMYGGILREITEAYIKQLMRIYGINSGTGYTVKRWQELMQLAGKGYYGVDCIGLVKSYYWSGKPNGGTGSPCYNPDTDINAKAMFYKATVKGKIKNLPEVPGLIVYSAAPVHVGVYIGNGQTIESTLGSRGDGVVKRKLDGLWEYWFECPYIEYGKPDNQSAPFAVGDKVKIKKSATTYAGSTITIPEKYKGDQQIYTISKISGEKALLKELYSWVRLSDLERA